MSQPRTFYVLGGGVSYGLVPLTHQMRGSIESDYNNIGVYPVTASPAAQSPLFERVVGHISQDETDIRTILLGRIPSGTLDLLTQRALCPSIQKDVPSQYAVFNVLGSPSTLFNFNLDGLAYKYCRYRHIVVEPHGRIDDGWLKAANWRELLEVTAIYEIKIPSLNWKLLPSPEPLGITRGSSYAIARNLLSLAPAVVIIGYSFGRWKDTLDDAQSFDYIVVLLKIQPRNIFVVSTTPDALVENLRDRLSSYNVFGLSLRWELFSGTILAHCHPKDGLQPPWCDQQLDRFIFAYEHSLDAH